MFSLICHFRFSIFVIENMKFEWQRSEYHELNPTCALGQCRELNPK